MSFDSLISRIIQTKNPSVVGLDPTPDYIPTHIKEQAFKEYGKNLEGISAAVTRFNKEIIDEIYDIVPAIKPQYAYYEAFGYHGMKALDDTIKYAKSKGMHVIADAKRNDIGSTMTAYAKAHIGLTEVDGEMFEAFGADSLTVNGYLGTDGIAPLIDVCKQHDKGIFVLVKTSNPSSGEFQDKLIEGKTLYSNMGEACENWGKETIGEFGYSAVGAVVGATYPEQLSELRKAMPTTFFLVPGYGAQGGGATDVIGAFDSKGLGAIINSSRGIITAWKKSPHSPENHAKAAREAAILMRDDITKHINL